MRARDYLFINSSGLDIGRTKDTDIERSTAVINTTIPRKTVRRFMKFHPDRDGGESRRQGYFPDIYGAVFTQIDLSSDQDEEVLSFTKYIVK